MPQNGTLKKGQLGVKRWDLGYRKFRQTHVCFSVGNSATSNQISSKIHLQYMDFTMDFV